MASPVLLPTASSHLAQRIVSHHCLTLGLPASPSPSEQAMNGEGRALLRHTAEPTVTSCHARRRPAWGSGFRSAGDGEGSSIEVLSQEPLAAPPPPAKRGCFPGCKDGAHPCRSEPRGAGDRQPGPRAASVVTSAVLTRCSGPLALENIAVLQDFFIPWSHTIKLLINLM